MSEPTPPGPWTHPVGPPPRRLVGLLLLLCACGPSSVQVEQSPPALQHGEVQASAETDGHVWGRVWAYGTAIVLPWQLVATIDVWADDLPETQTTLRVELAVRPLPGIPLSVAIILNWNIDAGAAYICVVGGPFKVCFPELGPPLTFLEMTP